MFLSLPSPSSAERRLCGESNCETRPSSRTRTRSESMMVLRRWATVSVVQSANSVRIRSWIIWSVLKSIDAVASSMSSSLVRRSMARARHTSCRCPTLKFSPYSATVQLSPPSSSTTSSIPTLASAARRSSSECSWNGSTLKRKSPEKSTESCGMIEMRLRRARRLTLPSSTPSTTIDPPVLAMVAPSSPFSSQGSAASTSRRIETSIDDLPLPVRPQTPIFSPGAMSMSRSLRTRSSPVR
mmetsp:Transcript_13570/g.28638  ORF Transcript_13570/g.28638 Transcript_13570/m.28638 type:complete len:241 (+) Transcript_13570:169-891(+)